MKKRFLCLMMAAVMTFGMAVTANAKEITGSGTVSYDGSNTLKTTFSTEELNTQISKVTPGDTLTLNIAIQNDGKKTVDFYMSNEIIEAFEKSESDSGGAYEYTLSYAGKNPRTIYHSDTVGGDNESNVKAETGLKQATTSLKNMFYLDTISAGEKGMVTLQVKLDGETEGNVYQGKSARIRTNFAIEEVREGTITQTVAMAPNDTNNVQTANTVKTGDISIALWVSVLAVAAGVILLTLGCMSVRRRRAGKGGF